ncbi:thiamine pyrophosphate-dependent dehydrogenase E1 component subunit alpha [Naasia sp. SYSU D00948]|uniref:thiamine pyrophosphate-dependent dehydrogenase E1 component subunit alpha n=1 Tax=Naasia sp. SYSU D00948 TaxID=2817379 RepID=UPI001B3094ED|nr:thiamine pyrophosphate-dependent dehydrogenase E1 component subunit alpha [Naasia sp. SYSU D00948]
MGTVPETPDDAVSVQIISPEGRYEPNAAAEEFLPYLERVDEDLLRRFYRDMVVIRRADAEAGHLQRQGQLALWVPSHGQEAAQVGSGHAARPQDSIFPAYREHAVGMIRGLDLLDIIRMLRGLTHGGWVPEEVGNFHLYTLVIGSQTLHATGYAMGIALDGKSGTGSPEEAEAALVYFGDGATSQGDTNEAMIWAASYQTPQVFFLQNNHWAISVPVSRQSRTPLVDRAAGFGLRSTRVDGNDVLASYAVTAKQLDDARAGRGPGFIEAITYRIGAHTTSDDPTRYREAEELAYWEARDPILRYRHHLEQRDLADGDWFRSVDQEAMDLAADLRRRTLALGTVDVGLIFDNVYAEDHPVVREQKQWLAAYEAGFGEAR